MALRSQPAAIRKAYIATSAQWRAVGVSPSLLRSLIRLGYLVQVRRGVYATRRAIVLTSSDPSRAHALEVAAVRVSMGRDVVGSHHSAALIHGLDLLKRPPAGTVTLTCPPPRRSRNRKAAGIIFHTAELPAAHVTRAYGTMITTAARTVIDLARTSPFIEAVVAADSALRTRKTTKDELRSVCDACRRWPGITQARRVLAFSDDHAESVLESCARVIFDSRGLDVPEVQATIRGPDFAFQVDFRWAKQKTIAEADSTEKHTGSEDVLAQFRRERLLRDAGYKVVRFTWRELFESPEVVIVRIRKALAAPAPS